MNISIQILSIGNELLEGQIVNTNATFVSSKLYAEGYVVQNQQTVADQPKLLIESMRSSLENFQVTICSGGLGPTLDDITLKAASECFESDFIFNEKFFEELKCKFQHLSVPNLDRFAYIPKKAKIFNNFLGMAPGFFFKKGKKLFILLPGVPYEFEHLVEKEVLPLLKELFPLKSKEHKKVIHLCRVAESAIAPYIEELAKNSPQVDFGIYPKLGIVSVHVKCKATSQANANQHIDPIIKLLKNKYPKRYFSGKFKSIQDALHHLFIRKKWTVSFAESCTGGALSAQFTQIPNASKYFMGSIIAYQNRVKNKQLGVLNSTLENEGAVSELCAKEMALGANKLFQTDLSFVTTGVAGPKGGTKNKPVGTVWIACSKKNKILFNKKIEVRGSRRVIIQRTILYLLAEFWMMRDNA
ncbi:MAG: Nicotinamide-nucleotide amidohydrolase PncC [Chlamydiae bacterium]|nr:Nicotinamide-nucleotide amidohydrolase PncC [Chlamydiota bacterium]